jgi:hypothetical protein
VRVLEAGGQAVWSSCVPTVESLALVERAAQHRGWADRISDRCPRSSPAPDLLILAVLPLHRVSV